jgi:predicted nucleic acid-binding protein
MQMIAPRFIDSNILLYLFSTDEKKADKAEKALAENSVINIQVLNEVTNVMRRKMKISWDDINEAQALIRSFCRIEPLTLEVHDRGKQIAERHQFSVYDSMIVAAALTARCEILYSEDMQHKWSVELTLEIINPFTPTLGTP